MQRDSLSLLHLSKEDPQSCHSDNALLTQCTISASRHETRLSQSIYQLKSTSAKYFPLNPSQILIHRPPWTLANPEHCTNRLWDASIQGLCGFTWRINWFEIFTCIGHWHPELLAASMWQLPSPPSPPAPPSPPPSTCLNPTEPLATPHWKPAQAGPECSGSTLYLGSSSSNANALSAQLQLAAAAVLSWLAGGWARLPHNLLLHRNLGQQLHLEEADQIWTFLPLLLGFDSSSKLMVQSMRWWRRHRVQRLLTQSSPLF